MSFSESESYSNSVHINVTGYIQEAFFLNLARKAPRSTGVRPYITGREKAAVPHVGSPIPRGKVLNVCTDEAFKN